MSQRILKIWTICLLLSFPFAITFAAPNSDPYPASGEQHDASTAKWVGDWQGGTVQVRVRLTDTGFHSKESKTVGDSAMFRWSNYDQIMILQIVSPGKGVITCYPSIGGDDFDRGQLPQVTSHWQVEAQAISVDGSSGAQPVGSGH